ncbi:hypothetical protein D1872_270900 [compost metagenome]
MIGVLCVGMRNAAPTGTRRHLFPCSGCRSGRARDGVPTDDGPLVGLVLGRQARTAAADGHGVGGVIHDDGGRILLYRCSSLAHLRIIE